jgi:carbon monoxide dehydrogenase subunit G
VKVERDTHIAATPEQVYDVVMDPRRLEDWVTIHQALVEAPDGPLQEGSTLAQRLKLAGRGFTVRWSVAENQRDERVVWEGKGPMHSRATVTYEFAEEEEGTRFSYANEYHLPGGLLDRMAGPAIRRVTAKEVDESLKRLKQLVES